MKANNMVKQIPMKHLAFFSLLCSSAASAAERPNIIYIHGSTDSQRHELCRKYGPAHS